MNIALIGATGYVGSKLLAEALDRGHRVTAVARDTGKLESRPHLTATSVDVLDTDGLAALLKGHDAVISAYSPKGDDKGPRSNLSLTGLYINNYNAKAAIGSTTGPDHRYTYGARLQGRLGRFTIDWMGYRQTGDHIGRPVEAYLTSLGTTAKFNPWGVPVDLGFRFDLATGGGGQQKTGKLTLFDPIYTDKGIYGESELFSYQNIKVFAPNASIRITPKIRVNLEYDFVYRQNTSDAFYTPTKAYANTQKFAGAYAGGQIRFNTYLDVTRNIFLRLEADKFTVGDFLHQAGFHNSFVIMPDITFRY